MTAALAAGSSLASLPGGARAGQVPRLKPGTFTTVVDDIKVYCKVGGSGPLIIMQNGVWLDTIDNYFPASLMDALAKHYTVLTFDARGQGRTTWGNGRVTYGRFAADTVRLMDKLNIQDAHFIGHSDGGIILLSLLIDFSDRVKTATVMGTPYSHEAYRPKTKAMFEEWFKEMEAGVAAPDRIGGPDKRKHYEAVSPNPRKYPEMLTQQRDCYATEPSFSLRQLARINRPVLVIAAGQDQHIPPEQLKLLADSIPDAQRVDFPQMTHDITPYVTEIATEASRFTQVHPQS